MPMRNENHKFLPKLDIEFYKTKGSRYEDETEGKRRIQGI